MSLWMEEARRVSFTDVASHLGLNHVRGRTITPCPACGAEKRGSTDPRGPVDVNERDGREMWHCKRCNVGGDAIDAAAFVVAGNRVTALGPDDKRRVAEWFSDRGWCTAPHGHERPSVVPAPKAARMPDDAVEGRRDYPPQAEVLRLWEACTRITREIVAGDEAPSAYLQDRGLDPAVLNPLDVVRALPVRLRNWPEWWPGDRWGIYRLAVLAYDATGEVRSIHARRVLKYHVRRLAGDTYLDPVCEQCGVALERYRNPQRVVERCPVAKCGWVPKPKTLWPAGVSCDRLLFADPGGVNVLRQAPGARRQTLVVEGLTDTLRAATVAAQVPCAVLGFTSGGAKALGDVRWPKGAEVGIATDDDEPGERYADEVADALRALKMRAKRIKWATLMPTGART